MTSQAAQIPADHVKELLSEEGFEVLDSAEDNVFHVRDLESGMRYTCVLEENILFNTLPCFSTSPESISPDMMRAMLDPENGISTSSFQLYRNPDGQVRVALTNFCKLQDLGTEDRDDIVSCVYFLRNDAVAARELLAEYL